MEYLEGEIGDAWIWIAFDPVNKVVVSYTIGKRQLPEARELLHQVHERAPKTIPYFTSDELEHYTSAIREEYGIEKIFPRTGERGRPKKPVKVVPPELVYTQVHKYREKGKVKKLE
ncbi:MAG: IS1 family transposase [Candidatus Helarchaeota archaeon]